LDVWVRGWRNVRDFLGHREEGKLMTHVRQTSIEVFHKLESQGLLSARRLEVYKILFAHGPLTCMEAFQHAKLHGNPDYRHNTHARLNELRERRVVQEIGQKTCTVTGHKAILWDVTDQLPVKPDQAKRPNPKQMALAAIQVQAVYAHWRQTKPQLPELEALLDWLRTKYRKT